MTSGFAEKQFFKLRKIVFRTCLDCFHSTQNLYVDKIYMLADPLGCPRQIASGIWTHDLQAWRPTLWPLCYRTLASREFCLLILSLRWLQGAEVGPGLRLRENNLFSRPAKLLFRHCPCEPQTQCFRLWKIVFSRTPERGNGMNPSRGIELLKGSSQALRKKRDLKNCFFRHCPCET